MSLSLTKLSFHLHLQQRKPLLVCMAVASNHNFNPNLKDRAAVAAAAAARDRVIEFGKHKGKILGSLPSSYLKWVSKNLRAREYEEWAILADQVLEDPVYEDRIQWEFAQNILSGGHDVVSELLEISERFGWDWDNRSSSNHEAGWRQVNFELLGTSKGGRIPRRNKLTATTATTATQTSETKMMQNVSSEGVGLTRRRERIDRRRVKREKSNSLPTEIKRTPTPTPTPNTQTDNPRNRIKINNPFPGRQTLLNRLNTTK